MSQTAEGFECAICMCPTQLEVGTLAGCPHAFDFLCVQQWLSSCSQCPVCKQEARTLYRHVLQRPVSASEGTVADVHRALPEPDEEIAIEERKLRTDQPGLDEAEAALLEAAYVCEGLHSPRICK